MRENLLIIPKDTQALIFLQELIQKLNIVKAMKVIHTDILKEDKKEIPKSKFHSQKDFLEGFGMFKNNPVDFNSIRKNAWSK